MAGAALWECGGMTCKRGGSHREVKEDTREVNLKRCSASSYARQVHMVSILHFGDHMICCRTELDTCSVHHIS